MSNLTRSIWLPGAHYAVEGDSPSVWGIDLAQDNNLLCKKHGQKIWLPGQSRRKTRRPNVYDSGSALSQQLGFYHSEHDTLNNAV